MKNELPSQADLLISKIFQERPQFHRGETEVNRTFSPEETCLSSAKVAALASGKAACYGIDLAVGRFIASNVDASSKSLETGSGLSTLVFAVRQAEHTCVTPNQSEVERIQAYANRKGISIRGIRFVIASSDKYLPTADLNFLDFAFIDGKHAFPWPVIDWFYTVNLLKQGGIVLVDDVNMISGRILFDFMKADTSRWQYLANFNRKTVAFRKIVTSVYDVAWHMQPYVVKSVNKQWILDPGIIRRVFRKGRRIFIGN
jgi:predicted O-methyltransferase YrrM